MIEDKENPGVTDGINPVVEPFIFGAESTQREPFNLDPLTQTLSRIDEKHIPQDLYNRLPENFNYSRDRELEKLQIQFPFLQISPYGNSVHTIVLSGSSVMVPIPAHARMMKIACGYNENVYMSLGNATPPSSSIYDSGVARVDSREWIACAGMSSISLYSTSAVVSIRFFSQL